MSVGVASAQMPDPRMMSGQIMPSPDLPTGTVTVRVIKQTIMNVVPGVEVELQGAGEVRRATTGPEGRAQFTGLPIGARVHAVVVVDGERLTSVEFDVPPSGGVRTLLAAGVGAGTPANGAAPSPEAPRSTAPGSAAEPGALVFGGDTRLAIEFQDDTLTVFYILQVVNRSARPVTPASPLVLELPADASGAGLLENGSSLGAVNGRQVRITGPFAAGVTEVPIAYRVERWDATWRLEQRFPLAIENIAMAVQKIGEMQLQSPQAPTMREAMLQGTPFLVATGATVPANSTLDLTVTGLPHHSRMPVYVALALAAALAAWGVWLASQSDEPATRGQASAARRELQARRDRGLAALAALEADYHGGRIDEAHYAGRRAVLVEQLERVYGELDEGGHLPGGGQGLAA
jgi:hypothetical protein